VPRRSHRFGAHRVGRVLADLSFPAAKWQLIVHADAHGADLAVRAQLWALPPGAYPTLESVLDALRPAPAPGPLRRRVASGRVGSVHVVRRRSVR